MGIAYKNFWSLNTDEAVVAGILRYKTNKNVEVLMPMNAQMKNIDLFLINLDSKKTASIQVKGSRAFEPNKSSLNKYGHGNGGWFTLDKKTVFEATADYFIFLVYVLEEDLKIGRRTLSPHSIIIPTSKLKEFTKKCKRISRNNKYNYYFWVNPKTKEAFDFRDELYGVDEYLDNSGFDQLNKFID